ncbi:MAG: AMP-binding protein [Clostridia bacterium]|nr:AMP-binding protein [Clostridia bacterium]
MEENFKPQKNKIYPEVYVDNFRELLDHTTKQFSNRIAFSYKKDASAKNPEFVNVSFKKHHEDVKAFSTKLINIGLTDKKVAIISHNQYAWPVSYMAINTGNMVCVPLDYLLPENEIENLLIRSKAEAIIFDGKFLEVFKNIKAKNTTNLKYYINMNSNEHTDDILSFWKLLEEGYSLIKNGDTSYDNITIDNDKMSIMLFTSGTTDISKAVMLSQRNICSNVSAMTTLIKYEQGDKVLSFLPLHHTFECTATYLFCFFIGFNICYCDGIKHIAKNLVEYKISGMVCVPAVLDVMYRQIWRTIKQKKLSTLVKIMMSISNFLLFFHIDIRRSLFKSILKPLGGKLRTIIYGSASADKKVINFFNSIGVRMIQGYGLTETSPVISCESDKYQKPGSAGRPLYCEDVRIINKDENGIGEITVKGPNVMLGYYENEELTNEVLIDGYFHTGDLGYIDKDGYLFITGRIKDMIVLKNGKKIFPQELEILLNNSPYIEESFVYVLPNDSDKLCTKLVYSVDNEAFKGKNETEIFDILKQEVQKVNEQIPKYKHIRNITISTDNFVKTTTQKIKRHEEIKKILGNEQK